MKICCCGCGEIIPESDSRNRPRSYARGHINRGKSNWWLITGNPMPRTSRERARKILDPKVCLWTSIGGCKGRIDTAHLDGNCMNNAPNNLLALCRSHHFLLDKGRIKLANPVMPRFYTDCSGKRRYS